LGKSTKTDAANPSWEVGNGDGLCQKDAANWFGKEVSELNWGRVQGFFPISGPKCIVLWFGNVGILAFWGTVVVVLVQPDVFRETLK